MAEDPRDRERREQVLRLLIEHRFGLHAFILALVGDPDLAEEALQSVAVVVCDRWMDFTLGTNFAAWARQIARNRVFTLVKQRRARRHVLSLDAVAGLDVAAAGFDGRTDRDERNALRACLGELPEDDRRAVRMRYEEGADCARVARQLGRTLAAVHMLLSRIRGRLAGCIEMRMAQQR